MAEVSDAASARPGPPPPDPDALVAATPTDAPPDPGGWGDLRLAVGLMAALLVLAGVLAGLVFLPGSHPDHYLLLTVLAAAGGPVLVGVAAVAIVIAETRFRRQERAHGPAWLQVQADPAFAAARYRRASLRSWYRVLLVFAVLAVVAAWGFVALAWTVMGIACGESAAMNC